MSFNGNSELEVSVSPGQNGSILDGPVETVGPAFDPAIFRAYLVALLPPVIGAAPEEIESIFDYDFEDRVARFAADNGSVIYVVKQKDETDGESCCLYSSNEKTSRLRRIHIP